MLDAANIDWTQVAFVEPAPVPAVELKTRPFRTVLEVKRAVAKRFGVTVAELESESRLKRLIRPRHIAMALAVRRLQPLGYSMPTIARAFGGRHHTTVLWAAKKYGYEPKGKARISGCKIPVRFLPPALPVVESHA